MTDVSVPVHTHAGILPTNAPVIIPQPVVPSAAPEILPPVASHQFRRNASETEPEIWCTGYTFFNGKPICMMSDGSEIEEQDGLQQIQRRFIIVAGRKIPIRAGVEPKYVPSPPRNYEAVARRLPPDPVNEAIILPTIHANHPGRDNYAPPSEMQGNYQN